MKKLLSVVVALVVVLGLTSTAFAAGSVADVVDVKATDANGAAIELTVADLNKDAGDPWLTEEKAAEVMNDGTKASELKVLWQKELTAATTPATLTFKASADAQEILLFHYVGDWTIEGRADGTEVSATVDSFSPFAIVIKLPAGAQKDAGKSANTGESNAIPFAAAAVIAAGALVVALNSKKRRA